MPTLRSHTRHLRATLLAGLLAIGLLAVPGASAQQTESSESASAGEVQNLRQNGIFDSERIEEMRRNRRVMLQEQIAERNARREMIRNNINHPVLQAGIEARRTHMERIAKLDRIKQIGEQNDDQALIDRALAARDLELRRYFMWRTYHRATASDFGGTIPQTDSTGE